MTAVPASDLQGAREIAATAHVIAIVTLVVLAIAIVFKVGPAVGAAIFGDQPWREGVQHVGAILIALLPTMLFYEAVNQLRRALNRYRDGEFFSAAAASRVAQAGDYAIGGVIAIILVVPNLTLWVSKRGGFDVNIESEFIGMLAFALFISLVGRILAAAAQLKTENDSFV